MPETYDTIIIGAGVAGFSAAMYAGRLKLKTLVIGAIRGGTIVQTNEIANWPGIKMTDGMKLAKSIEDHATSYEGIEVVDDRVIDVAKKDNGNTRKIEYLVKVEEGNEYSARSIIFATGTEWKKLSVPGEKEYTGKGVHYCALCDGYFYKGKTVAIVGGADSATKEAILLTQWASKVFIIYRGDKIRPEPITMIQAEEKIRDNKLEIIPNTNILEIKGATRVTHMILDKEHKGSKDFKVDGIFVEIGHTPQSQLAQKLGVKVNQKGDIIVNRSSETNIAGIFAAGDVTDGKFKQAITSSAEGVMAAYSAYEYVKK